MIRVVTHQGGAPLDQHRSRRCFERAVLKSKAGASAAFGLGPRRFGVGRGVAALLHVLLEGEQGELWRELARVRCERRHILLGSGSRLRQ